MPMTSFTLVGPVGADAAPVSIQCSVDKAKPPGFHVEGAALSQAQVKEISVRVRAAITATDPRAWPVGRVTVVIDAKGAKLSAPALDLPIALAIAGVDVVVNAQPGCRSTHAVRSAPYAAATLASGVEYRQACR